MTFTNTHCAVSIMFDFLWVRFQIDSPGNRQVHKQVNWQLSGQIFPIRNKITQEINK